MRMRHFFLPFSALFAFIFAVSCQAAEKKMRVGYFPNLTHAQALVGRETGRFEKEIPHVKFEWTIFNAGPSVIEAIFAGQMDIAYVGPGPTVNGFVKSNGEAIRAAEDPSRAPDFFDSQQIEDPVLRTQRLIQERLGRYFSAIRAVSFAHHGD